MDHRFITSPYQMGEGFREKHYHFERHIVCNGQVNFIYIMML